MREGEECEKRVRERRKGGDGEKGVGDGEESVWERDKGVGECVRKGERGSEGEGGENDAAPP